MVKTVDWQSFNEILERLSNIVGGLVCARRLDGELVKRVKADRILRDRDCIRELLAVARYLSDIGSDDLLRNSGAVALLPRGRLEKERGAEFHADLLASTWLGLYFLGSPFNEPWERAQRLIEYGGGYPHGACINKAMGDVYRWARRTLPRDYGRGPYRRVVSTVEGDVPCPLSALFGHLGLIVLMRRPKPLAPLADWESTRSITNPAFATLGRVYALLQLRLYIAEGLPITYIIPAYLIVDSLSSDSGAASAAEWIEVIVSGAPREDQHLVIAEQTNVIDGVPTCVLAHNRGVYTLDGLPENADMRAGIYFAGNRIDSSLTSSYRARLSGVQGKVVSWRSREELELMLRPRSGGAIPNAHAESSALSGASLTGGGSACGGP